MKIKKPDYIGIDHNVAKQKFEGDITFVNYMSVRLQCGRHVAAAVYKAASPNREKGHKDFMCLYSVVDAILMRSQMYVIGREPKEIERDAVTEGLHCVKCDTVITSLYRHDMVYCDCKENPSFIDGGRDYVRIGGDRSALRYCDVNLLTDEVIYVDGK